VAGFYLPEVYGEYAKEFVSSEWVDGYLYQIPDELRSDETGRKFQVHKDTAVYQAIAKDELCTTYEWVDNPMHWCRIACLALATSNQKITTFRATLENALEELRK
jgi:hypothetical protein